MVLKLCICKIAEFLSQKSRFLMSNQYELMRDNLCVCTDECNVKGHMLCVVSVVHYGYVYVNHFCLNV